MYSNIRIILSILLLALTFIFIPSINVLAGHVDIKETDTQEHGVAYFFDLRNRDTFLQVTNTDSSDTLLHIQIWDINQNCIENNFFDSFTANDTHIYNMSDIQTNDGNPSGIVLPANAYGAVIIFVTGPDDSNEIDSDRNVLIGSMRIVDDNGYEYRTNASGLNGTGQGTDFPELTFNFNTESGVILSDVIQFRIEGSENEGTGGNFYNLSDIFQSYIVLDVNILDKEENIFSCRDVTFGCVNENHPLLEALLEETGTSIASFEYGINEAIPHSRGGPLLCPGNTIEEGIVILDSVADRGSLAGAFIGLNNGNGRGSFDSWWQESSEAG